MQGFLLSASRWLVVALAIAIPISTALDSVLMAALLVTVLASNARAVGQAIAHNPVAQASALLFMVLLVGLGYGDIPLKAGIDILGKYADLALLPLLLVCLRDQATRSHAMQGFLIAMLLTALLSWLVGLGILPTSNWMWSGCLPENPAIFRSSITQNILMAYAAYLLVLQAQDTPLAGKRWLFAATALLMGTDVLFMVQGRTGYLVLLALLTMFCWHAAQAWFGTRGRRLGWRLPAAALLLVPLLLWSIYHVAPRLHDRIDQAVVEFQAWDPRIHNETSIGDRLEFYYNTYAIVERHPLIGVGTGGFEAAYGQQVRDKGLPTTHNPHNEYLLIAVQVGLLGLLAMLYFFYTQWRNAARLPTAYEQRAARGLVLTLAVTCLFNSPLLDHAEGIFFAFMSALWFAHLRDHNRHA